MSPDSEKSSVESRDGPSSSNSAIYQENDNDSGYTVVQRRKRQENSKGESVTSESSSVAHIQPLHGLTVIVILRDSTRLITKIYLLKVPDKLESLAPDGVIHVRPNARLNPLALDPGTVAQQHHSLLLL